MVLSIKSGTNRTASYGPVKDYCMVLMVSSCTRSVHVFGFMCDPSRSLTVKLSKFVAQVNLTSF